MRLARTFTFPCNRFKAIEREQHMTHAERLTIELVVMSQVKYMRDLAVIVSRTEVHAIDALWEEEKKTLGRYFQTWDRRSDETDGTKSDG